MQADFHKVDFVLSEEENKIAKVKLLHHLFSTKLVSTYKRASL